MQHRPGEASLVAILAALIVLACAAMAYTVYSRRQSAPQAAAPPAAAPNAQPEQQSANAAPLTALDLEAGHPPAATRDPFRPPMPSRVAGPLPAQAQATAAGRYAPAAQPAFAAPRPAPAVVLLRTPRPLPRPVAARAPVPAIELKGVIPGEPAIAVVVMDGRTAYRQEGDGIGQGWTVARITEAGLVMKRGRENHIVEVGHSSGPPASSAGAANEPVRPALPEPVSAARPVPAIGVHAERATRPTGSVRARRTWHRARKPWHRAHVRSLARLHRPAARRRHVAVRRTHWTGRRL